MKCLSLWQPWATLVVNEDKMIETRSWGTNYRGLLAIHAAKRWGASIAQICMREPFRSALSAWAKDKRLDMSRRDEQLLPFGSIIGTVRLSSVFKIEGPADIQNVGHPELEFGDYSVGRFMWILDSAKMFRDPIPCVGRQGLFDVPDSVIADAVFESWDR